MNELERIEGGASMSCNEFIEVLAWLADNGHYEQLAVVQGYYPQYCGGVQ